MKLAIISTILLLSSLVYSQSILIESQDDSGSRIIKKINNDSHPTLYNLTTKTLRLRTSNSTVMDIGLLDFSEVDKDNGSKVDVSIVQVSDNKFFALLAEYQIFTIKDIIKSSKGMKLKLYSHESNDLISEYIVKSVHLDKYNAIILEKFDK